MTTFANLPNSEIEGLQQQMSLSTEAARKLATTTKTQPQMQGHQLAVAVKTAALDRNGGW
jgi:hypothetical protein